MSSLDFIKVGTLRSVAAFRDALRSLAIELPCDDAVPPSPHSSLSQPATVLGRSVGNRFCIQPMEGWDGTPDGRPSEHTFRRWRRFGASGAKLIWGCEAVAVRHQGRANPNQLLLTPRHAADFSRLLEALLDAHHDAERSEGLAGASEPLVGLQLTHSGRFSRPNRHERAEPVIAYRHPILDRRLGITDDNAVISDGEIRRLVDDYAGAARLAKRCGFDFVDLKHCHGYLGHEILSAHTRPGDYGGSLANRARFLRELVEAVRSEAPGLGIGVRVSAFDSVPFEPDAGRAAPGKLGPGIASDHCACMPYLYGFGVDPEQPTEMDLTEPLQLLTMMRDLGVTFVNVTAGSPYYSHHLQRPALYPPSDGYQPPEDPLVGVARLMHVARFIKERCPDLTIVGTGYTYLQEFLPNVAHAAVRDKWVDFVGIGRMALAYSDLPRDVLAGRPLQRKRLCRTFSDCTTAPRSGLVSGCYPLDAYYGSGEMRARLDAAKARLRARLGG